MKVGYGLISTQRYPGDPRSDEQLYAEALELAAEAERLGFDSVWTSEHHFVDDAYLPSVLPMCAAIAARTSQVEIGTALLLAPLYDPVHLAEDAAVVDLISRGRLILGLGIGWRAEEFEGLHVPLPERAERIEESIAVLRQAWGEGLVTGTPRRAYPGISVTPKPSRPGGPPIWIGAFAERAVRRAGRMADGFMGTEVTPAEFGRQADLVREAARAAGRDPEAIALSLHMPTFAWDDGDPWPLVRDHHHYVAWKYVDMEEARGRETGPVPKPPIAPDEEQALRDQILMGSSAEVAEQILAYDRAAGGNVHYIARLYWPGMPFELQQRTMAVFAERVIPRLRAGGDEPS
jgi:alkanesulfonate monooxygenase SsuD/methylene tetrahydromethanopterin reductase-like flavin-dependent oxidoreductase (luciferase family)